jgi:hypothetical protein
VVDSTFVNEVPPGGVIAIPFTRLARVPKGTEELNRQALNLGMEAARQAALAKV